MLQKFTSIGIYQKNLPNRNMIYLKYDSLENEFEELKYCDKKIEFLSTPFDLESATFLNDLMDVYKYHLLILQINHL